MGFLWWGRKEEERNFEEIEEEIKRSFSKVREDFKKTGDWIKHLDSKDSSHETNLKELGSKLATLEKDVEELKQYISFFGPGVFKQLSKQVKTGVVKQTCVEGVQTPVQTGVEADFFRNLSTMERAIISVLLYHDMKLSYEDLSVMLGKERSTIRGQINAIRKKSEGLVEEVIEKTGKKRVYIPEHMKNYIFRTIKIPSKKGRKMLRIQKSE